MFEKQRKLRLIKRLGILGKEIPSLKTKLNDVNEKKEFWFKKKNDLKKQISGLVNQAKEIKVKKDNFNEDVKGLKEQRNKYNKEVGELISKAKLLSRERAEALKKYNLGLSPSRIKDKVEELELQIETQALPFKREQKIMKQIKRLRDGYNKSTEIKKIMGKIDKFSGEIDSSKKKADGFHKMIQEQAKLNQEGYEGFIEISKKINNFRSEQEIAFKKFLRLKRVFVETNNSLKSRLVEDGKVKGEYNKVIEYLNKRYGDTEKRSGNKDKRYSDEDSRILEEKSRNVEEKLKKKQKLTTEDILVFQKKEEKSGRIN